MNNSEELLAMLRELQIKIDMEKQLLQAIGELEELARKI